MIVETRIAAMSIEPTNTSPLRLIFMGSPEFAVPCLQSLIDSPHEVVAVYCQPPRPAGRGHKLRPTPVQALAEQYEIPVHHPTSLKSEAAQAQFAAYQPDAAIVAAYGLLLPQAILDIPARGCINLHPSKLPRWRGAAPLQRTIMAGDSETAMCIMQMEAGLDTGPILHEQPLSIADGTTAGQLHDTMATLAGPAVLKVLAEQPSPRAQAEQGVTYAAKITKAEAQIDWNQPAPHLRQHILGLSPFPAAWTPYQGETIKILRAELANGSGTPGELLDDALTVACGEGALRLTQLQRPGKRVMEAEAFLRGYALPAGERFSPCPAAN